MTVMGDWSGNPYARIGEPNALTGGQPTREVMNVTPMEPSVPMQQQPMMAPPPTAFAMLMEQMFPMRGSGRNRQKVAG